MKKKTTQNRNDRSENGQGLGDGRWNFQNLFSDLENKRNYMRKEES